MNPFGPLLEYSLILLQSHLTLYIKVGIFNSLGSILASLLHLEIYLFLLGFLIYWSIIFKIFPNDPLDFSSTCCKIPFLSQFLLI
jgi:hypothetical protein